MSRFVLSCTTCATRGIDGDETAACFRYAPRAGFRAWGIASVAQRALGEARWLDAGKLRGAAQAVGLRRCTEVYAPTFPADSEAAAEAAAEQVAGVFALAEGLGAPLVVMTGGMSPARAAAIRDGLVSAPRRGRIRSVGLAAPIAGIKRLLPLVEHLPVRLALEPHHGSNFSVRADFDRIFSEIDHPKVGITIDTGHFHCSEVDWRAFIRAYGDRIWNLHVKDHRGPVSVPLGAGEIDLRGYLEELHALDYDGPLALELEVEDPENLPRYVTDAHAYLTRLVREVTGSDPE